MAESVAQAAMDSDRKTPLDAGTMAVIAIGSVLFIVILISSYLYFRKWRWHPTVSHQRSGPTTYKRPFRPNTGTAGQRQLGTGKR